MNPRTTEPHRSDSSSNHSIITESMLLWFSKLNCNKALRTLLRLEGAREGETALCRKCSGGRTKMTSNGSSRPAGSLEDHLRHHPQSSGRFLSAGLTGITNGEWAPLAVNCLVRGLELQENAAGGGMRWGWGCTFVWKFQHLGTHSLCMTSSVRFCKYADVHSTSLYSSKKYRSEHGAFKVRIICSLNASGLGDNAFHLLR